MARPAMPRLCRGEMATGELTQVTVTLGDGVSTKFPYEKWFIGS
jgi:hypothetical protein